MPWLEDPCSSSDFFTRPSASHGRNSPRLIRVKPTSQRQPCHLYLFNLLRSQKENLFCFGSSRPSPCLPSDTTPSKKMYLFVLLSTFSPTFAFSPAAPLSEDLLVQVSDFRQNMFCKVLRSFAHQISLSFRHSQKISLPFAHLFDDLAELLALLLLSCTHRRKLVPS